MVKIFSWSQIPQMKRFGFRFWKTISFCHLHKLDDDGIFAIILLKVSLKSIIWKMIAGYFWQNSQDSTRFAPKKNHTSFLGTEKNKP